MSHDSKRHSLNRLRLGAVVLALASLGACGGGGDATPAAPNPLTVDASTGLSTMNSTALDAALATVPMQALSPTEAASLVFMREEEKLAGDIYLRMDALWGASMPIFRNIAGSEATHTEAVRTLLVRYNLPDPAANLGPGVYQNATLQSLYAQLVAAGSASLVAGLQVGATIEELDIVDLSNQLKDVDNPDIVLVYQNLMKGSRNHLRSFYRTLQQLGATYVPQYLSPADFAAIVNSPIER